MKLETIRRIVLAAVLLPFLFMIVEGALLIGHSFQQYTLLRQDREMAELLALGGLIASREIPASMEATRNYLANPSAETRQALDGARAGLDRARSDFFKGLPETLRQDPALKVELSKLAQAYSRIVALRSAVDAGYYQRGSDVGNVFRQAALRQLGIGDSLSTLIQDPVLLRKSGTLMGVLLTYHGELVIDALGRRYLNQNGLSAFSRDQAVQGDVYRRLGTDRLRFHTSSPLVRDILSFYARPDEVRADLVTRAILAGALKPAPKLYDSWTLAQEARLDFLREKILAVTTDLRSSGGELAKRAQFHLSVVVGLSAALAVFVTLIVALATKGIHLVDRLTREREVLVGELRRAAQTDVLTGLYNRRGFETAAVVFSASARALSLVLFDIDRFKAVNDVHGHDAGDAILRRIAEIAEAEFRDSDLICRYGGEEFMALLPDATMEEAVAAGERVRRAVEAATFRLPSGGTLRATASFGCVSRRQGQDVDLQALVKRADMALYAAKASGRNRVVADEDVARSHEKRRRVAPA